MEEIHEAFSYIYIYIHIHIYTHTHTHIYIYIYISVLEIHELGVGRQSKLFPFI